MEHVNKEIYEQVRAQVLRELAEEKREKARERERIRKEAERCFTSLAQEYLAKVVIRYRCDCYGARRKIEDVIETALHTVGVKDKMAAVRLGKTEEVKDMTRRLLDEILR